MEPLINMEPLKLFSSSFLRGIDPHSGSVYPHSGCLCYEGVEGENPDNHGALKVVFQYSSSYHRGIGPHSGSVYPVTTVVPYAHRVIVCGARDRGGNPGTLKVVFQ